MRKQEFDDEIVLTYDRVQDKFQLPALQELFTRVAAHIDIIGTDNNVRFNPMALAHGYLIRSGRKILTDYFIQLPDWAGRYGTGDVVDVLYNVISLTFVRKWKQLRDAFYTEYSPLEGVDYTETHNSSHEGTETVSGTTIDELDKTDTTTHGEQVTTQNNLVHGETVTDNNTTTHGKTVAETGTTNYSHSQTDTTTELPGQTTTTTASSTGAENVYGFNSSVAVPNSVDSASNTETVTSSGRNSIEVNRVNQGHDDTQSSVTEGGTTADLRSISHGGTDSSNGSVLHSGNDVLATESSQTETVTREGTTSGTKQLQILRKGRLTQTPQDLLEAELRARKQNLVEIIYQDIDSVLTISVY